MKRNEICLHALETPLHSCVLPLHAPRALLCLGSARTPDLAPCVDALGSSSAILDGVREPEREAQEGGG